MKHIIAATFLMLTFAACRTSTLPPNRLPAGYVFTPNGLFHQSCVREIPKGYRISQEGVITAPDGKRETLPRCAHPRLDARTFKPIPDGESSPEVNGWVLSAGWPSPVPLGALGAQVVVPTAPTAPGGLSYFFPGLTPVNQSGPIMQPVLASHPDGSWTINAAFCCPQGWTTHATPVSVNPGDTIAGLIATTSCSSTSCDWEIGAVDTTTNTSVGLAADDVTYSMQHTAGGVLEAYGITSCDQYPASGTITFSDITFTDQNGNSLNPTFGAHNWNQPLDCNYGISSTSTTVTLTY